MRNIKHGKDFADKTDEEECRETKKTGFQYILYHGGNACPEWRTPVGDHSSAEQRTGSRAAGGYAFCAGAGEYSLSFCGAGFKYQPSGGAPGLPCNERGL